MAADVAAEAPLRIYGIPASQPVRAVIWTCLIKKLPFELILTSQNRDAKSEEFRRLNPRGTVPTIDDGGVVLWESHAILVYLCEKHSWRDLWPNDLVARARVNQYLHFHHRNTRELVIQWSRTLWPSVFDVRDPDPGWIRRNTFPGLENNAQVVRQALEIIDEWLSTSPWIASETGPTLADICAYEELGQNQADFANCTDYSALPNIRRWLAAMRELPGHDDAHAVWRLLGDVNTISGGMKTVARANKEAAAVLREAVERLV